MAEVPGLIDARDLTKRFGDKVAVDHLSFSVLPGRVTGFLGPNGAGKSTTMRLILGLDPEGIRWVRTFMQGLAAEGRTVLVSSHLMSEMAVTADHLVVIGRGRLIAESSTQEFIERSSERSVLVRTPDGDRLRELIMAEGGKTRPEDGNGTGDTGDGTADGVASMIVTGLPARRIGELAASASVVLHELTPRLPSLEEAFMEMTADSVEYGQAEHGRAPLGESSAS